MAKYRLLTEEELKSFEKEFIEYLIVNGIVAEDWVKIKESEPDKAAKIVELFSDVIMEGVLRKINFLEIHTPNYVQTIHCMPNKMAMVAVTDDSPETDLTKQTLAEVVKDEKGTANMHYGEKKYSENREQELYEMVNKGYEVSDGKLYKSLLLVKAEL